MRNIFINFILFCCCMFIAAETFGYNDTAATEFNVSQEMPTLAYSGIVGFEPGETKRFNYYSHIITITNGTDYPFCCVLTCDEGALVLSIVNFFEGCKTYQLHQGVPFVWNGESFIMIDKNGFVSQYQP